MAFSYNAFGIIVGPCLLFAQNAAEASVSLKVKPKAFPVARSVLCDLTVTSVLPWLPSFFFNIYIYFDFLILFVFTFLFFNFLK